MKIHLLALISVLLPVSVFAQEAALRPDVEELLVLTRTQKMMDSYMESAKGMFGEAFAKQMTGGNKLSPDAMQKIAVIQGKAFDLMKEEMSWAKLKGDFGKIYEEVFTPEEIKGLIAFYKTPTGQSLLDKTPALMQKSMEITQTKLATMMPKVQAMVAEEMKSSADESASQPAAPAKP